MNIISNRFDRAEAALLIIFFGVYFVMSLFGLGGYWERFNTGDTLIAFSLFPLMLLINRYGLIPKFILRKREVLYSVILAGILIGLELVKSRFWDSRMVENKEHISAFIPAIAGVVLSWILFLSNDWFQKSEHIEKIKAEKMKYELDYLKGQINPHFLFNAMNSIYSNALNENAPETAGHIADLSYLLRYNLYDSARDFIPVSKEIEFLKKYIRIQETRLSEKTKIILKFTEQSAPEAGLAPLLCIPVIENVFKYGVNPAKESKIWITIETDRDELRLQTQNTVFYPERNADSGGIGLANLRRRLEIMYPDRHSLKTGTVGHLYIADLSIKLK